MTAPGRPLRFLVVLIGLWIGMRVVQLRPADEAAIVAEAIALPVAASAATRTVAADPVRHDASTQFPKAPAAPRRVALRALRSFGAIGPIPVRQDARAPVLQSGHAAAVADPVASPATYPGVPLSPQSTASPRLAGSAWLIARGGRVTPFAPQLGGSQAGVRLTYALDPDRRLALAGRLSTALESRQREAGIGFDWQPTRLPIHVVAEQRIAIDQARGGPSLALIGGIGPTSIAGRLRLDAYAQGGAIARDGVEGFVDGAVRIAQPVATLARGELQLGIGAWGGAQRGASRLDVGPTASLVVPVAKRSVRVSVEWRERIAGRAAPASGPALAIGTDF